MLVILLVFAGGCSHAAHYRTYRDGKSLYAVLHESVAPGDTIEKVEELLGLGREANHVTLMAAEKLAREHPAAYPDGFEKGDRIIGYPIENTGVLNLQFRRGKLVNYSPAHFEKWEPIPVINDG